MRKCIIGLDVFDLFSCHFYDPKSLQNLDYQRDKMTLDLRSEGAAGEIIGLIFFAKWGEFVKEIIPRYRSLPGPIKSLKDLVEFPLIKCYFVV